MIELCINLFLEQLQLHFFTSHIVTQNHEKFVKVCSSQTFFVLYRISDCPEYFFELFYFRHFLPFILPNFFTANFFNQILVELFEISKTKKRGCSIEERITGGDLNEDREFVVGPSWVVTCVLT
jgi:hypothetical protein